MIIGHVTFFYIKHYIFCILYNFIEYICELVIVHFRNKSLEKCLKPTIDKISNKK